MISLNLACVVGARPNFMKVAPLLRALAGYSHVRPTLVHTGQHYDDNLSAVFFRELEMPAPDVHLEVGSGKQGAQTARILERFEAFLEQGPPGGGRFDRVVVVGDVNSTMAATLAAVKLGVPVAHVEAGLRSFDRSMPEEINRIVTDAVSDLLFVSEPAGMVNLRREGHAEEHLHMVGNVMIDTLQRLLPKAREAHILERTPIASGPVWRGHAAPSEQRGPAGNARPDPPGPGGDLRRIAAGLSDSSPDPCRGIERFGLMDESSARSGNCRIAAAGLSGFPGSDLPGPSDRYRFGRAPGGVHGAGDTLSHHAA